MLRNIGCISVCILILLAGCGSKPMLDLSKTEIEFGPRDTNKTLKITNSGGGNLKWELQSPHSWITFMPSKGEIKNDTTYVFLKINRTSIQPGKHNIDLKLNTNAGDTLVNLTIIQYNNPVVELQTSMGNIKLKLFPDVAPRHVDNFLNLVKSGFYDGLIFHRVIDGFMIQGGKPNQDGSDSTPNKVPLEPSDSLHHEGSLGMARGNDPNSATSQFYICLTPQPRLDGKYTVFGSTIEGLDVVKTIGKLPTTKKSKQPFDKPLEDVIINKAVVIEDFMPIE